MVNRGTHIECVPGAIDRDMCRSIVEAGDRLRLESDSVDTGVAHQVDRRVRDSDIAYFPVDGRYGPIYEKMTAIFQAANQAAWQYRITRLEPLQYTAYGRRQHYNWHTDTFDRAYSEGSELAGLFRQLSVTVQLTEADAYEGGDLQIMRSQLDNEITTFSDAREIGTAIVFPSFMRHKVAPVAKGRRRSLVGWFLGPLYV